MKVLTISVLRRRSGQIEYLMTVHSRRPLQSAVVLGLLALLLLAKGSLSTAQAPARQQEIQESEQRLSKARAKHKQREEARLLLALGSLYSSDGKKEKALQYDEQALAIYRLLKLRPLEGTALMDAGLLAADLGKNEKALEDLKEALPLLRETGDHSNEGTVTSKIGEVYYALGDKQKALDFFNDALPIRRQAKDRSGEAETLDNLGVVYKDLGQKDKALESYNEALGVYTAIADDTGTAATLNGMAQVHIDAHENKEALDDLNRALPILKKVGDRRTEASDLGQAGEAYMAIGDPRKALDSFNQALSISRETKDRHLEAIMLADLGEVSYAQDQKQKSLELMKEALPVIHETGDRRAEANLLSDLGMISNDFGQTEQALDYFNQALSISRDVGDKAGVAERLNNVGYIYFETGQKQKALDYDKQALTILREVKDRTGEARTLNNIGGVYENMGQIEMALEYYLEALPIRREVHNRVGEANTLSNIGKVYDMLDQKEQSLDYYNQALSIERDGGDRSGSSVTLSNIAMVYDQLGQDQKALEFYNQALTIQRDVGDLRHEAITLSSIGVVYSKLGEQQKALDDYNQALVIHRKVKDPGSESRTLRDIGASEHALKHEKNALRADLAALSLAKAIRDPDAQGKTDATLMTYFRDEGHPETAIFFGFDAVNSYQQIRKNISGLNKDLQSSYAKSKSATYRELAELLVQIDRLSEAELVLDLLKEEELKEVVRGAANSSRVEPVPLSTEEEKGLNELAAPEKTAVTVTDLSVEYASLLAKPNRTPEEEGRLKALDTSISAGNAEVSEFFTKTLYPELATAANTETANAVLHKEKLEVNSLQNTLGQLNSRVIGIRLLFGNEHAYAIVVTAHGRKRFELGTAPADLRSKVLQVRDELRNPASDPRSHLAELYRIVVAPMSGELNALEKRSSADRVAPTLLWSLDGVLRYLPMAALFDGKRFMLERFNNVLFTPESYGHMTAAPREGDAQLHALAAGLSKSFAGLPALPEVMPELQAVVHDPVTPGSHGPMEGKILPNEMFTFDALKTTLGAGTAFPVVHIASHFVVEAGARQEPYLPLAGESKGTLNGYALTLSGLADSPISFHGTKLLTLSACSTGKGVATQNGMEMDSLGMVAQQKDAEAVLATLWDVNDSSTSSLMGDFYARWIKNPALGKAEALRQAQLAFLHSKPVAGSNNTEPRGLRIEESKNPTTREAKYSHPFYWAPYVLTGNYQ